MRLSNVKRNLLQHLSARPIPVNQARRMGCWDEIISLDLAGYIVREGGWDSRRGSRGTLVYVLTEKGQKHLAKPRKAPRTNKSEIEAPQPKATPSNFSWLSHDLDRQQCAEEAERFAYEGGRSLHTALYWLREALGDESKGTHLIEFFRARGERDLADEARELQATCSAAGVHRNERLTQERVLCALRHGRNLLAAYTRLKVGPPDFSPPEWRDARNG